MTFTCKYIVCGVAVAAVEGLNLNRMMNGKQPSREANPDFDNLRITMEGAFQEAHRVLEQQPRPVNPTGSASLVAEVLADGKVTAAEGQDLVSKFLRQQIPQSDVDANFVASSLHLKKVSIFTIISIPSFFAASCPLSFGSHFPHFVSGPRHRQWRAGHKRTIVG
jgi:hypothetical protein